MYNENDLSSANTIITEKNHKNTRKKQLAVIIVMFFVIVVLIISVVVMLTKINSLQKSIDNQYLIEDFVPAVNTRVYDFYEDGDSIYFDDSFLGLIRIPALTNVPKSAYNYDNLILENERYTYHDQNGSIISKAGIDISYHQKDIDWKAVAADDIDFAFIRVGYRGYEEGKLNLDSQFENHIRGALKSGIDVGIYFYSQALTVEEAIEEAEFVLKYIDKYKITYPVVYDWELPEADNARTKNMDPETLTECAAAFCDTIADAGYIPMVYAGRKQALLFMDMSKLAAYDFWFPQYKNGHNPPEYPYDFQIWQYASDGKVDGITGDVDLNICFVDYTSKVRGRY